MKQCYCRLNFHNFGNSKLEIFTSEVIDGVYGNTAVFPTPPYTATIFNGVAQTLITAAAAYKKLGLTKKTPYEAAKKNLLMHLDGTAVYVNTVAMGDVSIIADAGFTPSKAQTQRFPAVEKIEEFSVGGTKVSGDMALEIPAITNRGTVAYTCICSEGEPLKNPKFVDGQLRFDGGSNVFTDATRSRKKTIHSLTPGTQCYFYVYATNAAGVSPLSDAKIVWVS